MTPSVKLRNEVLEQISERGRLISEVAQDFGISNRQVYRWLKAEKPAKQDAQKQLLENEIARLRVHLFRVSQQLTALKSQLNQ